VELSDVDARLTTVEREWRNFSPQQVGKSIGCDVLLYGEVTDAGRLYLALYSQLTVAATVRLVDVTTGQTLVQESYATKFREAGVPLSPLSIVSDVVKTWVNLSETQMVRAIDDLGRNLAEMIPDLPAILPPSSGQSVVAAASPSPHPLATTPVNRATTTLAAHNSQPITTVTVAALSIPAPVSGAIKNISPPLPSRPVTQEQYRLQVAAFRTYEDAQRMVRLLRDKGYPAMIAQTGASEKMWNQVVLGPFPSRAAALKVGVAIKKIAPLSPVVIPRPRH
jgi:cell division septation protein DedD